MIMHVDGNSFYASCERLFRPDLSAKPIVVLTNNDGIIIALTQEAKDLGYARGDVFFKIKNKLKKDGVAVFSSNYTLYNDICCRVNVIYNRFAADVELYSIDESFLFFPDWNNADYTAIAHEIRNTVKREIGITVSIGVAPSKTLAKLCDKLAKKRGGVCEWAKLDQDAELAKYDAGDVWGIGRSKAEFLKGHGVKTALDLKNYPPDMAKKHLSVTGLRTVQEMNGIAAIDKTIRERHQSIMVSRSFASAVTALPELIPPLMEYTQEAVKRLREEKQGCKFISVYLMTSHKNESNRYYNYACAELDKPSSYLPEISTCAVSLLRKIYRAGYNYRKAMIILTGLTPHGSTQPELFDDNESKQQKDRLMQTFDAINDKFGRGKIRLGISGAAKNSENAPWKMKREMLSPNYTTRLSDIPKVG